MRFKPSPLAFFCHLVVAEACTWTFGMTRAEVANLQDMDYMVRRQARFLETPAQKETRRKRERRQTRAYERKSYAIAVSHGQYAGDCYCTHCAQ